MIIKSPISIDLYLIDTDKSTTLSALNSNRSKKNITTFKQIRIIPGGGYHPSKNKYGLISI